MTEPHGVFGVVARHPARFTLFCCTIVGVISLGFAQYRYTQSLDNVCEGNAETRQVLVDVASVLSSDTPIPPGTDEATAARIDKSNKAKATVRQVVGDVSAPDPCNDGELPPSRAGEYRLPS